MPHKVMVVQHDAVGGPPASAMAGDGFEAGPTYAGEYRVAYCGRHSSRRYASWSKFRWGSSVKDESGTVKVLHDGRWIDITTVGLTRDAILDQHELLYNTRTIPGQWVFNDFGHQTCYFYKDRNNNQKLDKNERIHGEFFHTTPPDEANTALGKPVVLTESHGCIHLKPIDIDDMVKKGYMKRGNKVVVHPYSAMVPAYPNDAYGKPPFELHFYPGPRILGVTGMSRF